MLFFPEKCRVGFQDRRDTYTGKLAYVVGIEPAPAKGLSSVKIRKEKSFEAWRSHDLGIVDFDNVPTEGFVFHDPIRRSGYYGSGRNLLRVYDPRGFEIELNVPNLSNLLLNAEVSAGAIKTPCVYAWDGADLVLLPASSGDMKELLEKRALYHGKVSKKELTPGKIVRLKDTTGVYLGYLPYVAYDTALAKFRGYNSSAPTDQHIIACTGSDAKVYFVNYSSVSPLKAITGDCDKGEFTELLRSYKLSTHFNFTQGFKLVPFHKSPVEQEKFRTSYLIASFEDGSGNISYYFVNGYTILDTDIAKSYSAKQQLASGEIQEAEYDSKMALILKDYVRSRGTYGMRPIVLNGASESQEFSGITELTISGQIDRTLSNGQYENGKLYAVCVKRLLNETYL